jgi:hypothetical protein
MWASISAAVIRPDEAGAGAPCAMTRSALPPSTKRVPVRAKVSGLRLLIPARFEGGGRIYSAPTMVPRSG